MLSVVNKPFMLSVVNKALYAKCHYPECRGASKVSYQKSENCDFAVKLIL
jgi:hypothetical protein